jgi:hypothetical protein
LNIKSSIVNPLYIGTKGFGNLPEIDFRRDPTPPANTTTSVI